MPGRENKFDCVTPILNVSDMQQSLRYYRDVLGFSVAWEWGEPTGFACVKRGNVELFFCHQGQGVGSCWLSIFVADIDELHKEYLASGAIIRQPPTNFPWGVREMNIEDPDGHRLRIGSESNAESDNQALVE